MANKRTYITLTIEEKKQALNRLRITNNVEQTAREYNVTPKTVRDWRKQEHTIMATPHGWWRSSTVRKRQIHIFLFPASF